MTVCGESLRYPRSAACLAALAMAASGAVPAHASDDSQVWVNTTAVVKLSDRWRFSEDVTARFSDDRNGLYEVELNSLLGYRIGKSVTLWAGYTHDPNYSAVGRTVMEHRGREQVSFDNFARLGRGTFNGRMRVEQRWREGKNGTGWRIRPYLKYSLPLRHDGKTALVFSSELFLNLNRTSFQRTAGVDRLRSLVAISTPLSRNISAELGYLNQHTFVRAGPDNDDHIASAAVSLAF
jgi:hypothetical protein